MKASQIAAKIVVRLFLLLLIFASLPFFTGDTSKLNHVYFTVHNWWILIPPALLILGFITLLIICAKNKYTKTDLNWLLVLNTVILIAYGVTLFIKIYQMVK
jgi:cytochrome bd-type quinol oxidase subunit 2